MTNPNVGQKVKISSTTDKIIAQATKNAQSAVLTKSSAAAVGANNISPSNPPRTRNQGRGVQQLLPAAAAASSRKQSKTQPTTVTKTASEKALRLKDRKPKTVYFDIKVYETLKTAIEQNGRSVSHYLGELVKKDLGIVA
ncbi:MAG: hypothetical protein LBI42_02960 [Chitinispirillales bacterium]|jgi:hypothetical protein|nr:hypothetical protein [Chitinispirillales bacterium]